MAKTIYKNIGYYKRGNLVYGVPIGPKLKKIISERRQHKNYRCNWDLTKLFYKEEYQR